MVDDKKTESFHSAPGSLLLMSLLVVVLGSSFTVIHRGTDTTMLSSAECHQKAPQTGVCFAREETFLQEVSGSRPLQLLGVGTRKKAILNVYSIGFYGDDRLVKQIQNHIKSKNQSNNSGNNNASSKCKAILSSNKGARAARIQFNMGVGADKVAEALTSVLQGVAQKTKEEFGDMVMTGISGDDRDAAGDKNSGENNEKWKKGDIMTLEWKPPNHVFVTARGEYIGQIKDKDLYNGLLNVYLGPNSVSPSLKDSIEKTAAIK